MASADQIILALGASHLSVTNITGDPAGNLLMEQVIHQSISGDPGAKDLWVSSAEAALGQLALRTPLKDVTGLVLPGWAVLTKVIKVTRIEGDGQREVVRYEAENALPNGLEGFDWTYGILRDDGYERDVLVQAVSNTFLNKILGWLNRYGAQISFIDALISAELCGLGQQYASDEGASVLLDVGARSVSLIVSSEHEIPFLRSFNFGARIVTQALANQLGKSYEEAERYKIEWLRTNGGGANLEALNQASEGFVNRLVNEVQRSLTLYRRQGQTGNPARILLTGGGSQLPGLADFLQRKTGIPTTFYDPFRGVSSGPNLPTTQTSQIAYVLPSPLGMAFGYRDPKIVRGNLLPKALVSKLQFSEKKPWLLAAACLFLLSGIIVGFKYHLKAWDSQGRIATLEAELAPLESLSLDVDEAHKEYTELLAKTAAKERILHQRHYWVGFLADMQNRLNKVQDVWLESMQPEDSAAESKEERLRVTGSLLDREHPLSLVSSNSRRRVEALLQSIAASPFILSVENRRFDTTRPGILQFDVSLVVNPEALF
jgi:type IV pilus assembly protein PilM